MPEMIIKFGREKSLQRRHPWIFSGSIAGVKGAPKAGETIDVISSTGGFLARAAYSPNSNIVGRVWTWNPNEHVDFNYFENRLMKAMDMRQTIQAFIQSDSMRLVHAESDGLPGLILDRYGDVLVAQLLTAGIEYWRTTIVEVIKSVTDARVLYERSDADVRILEGLEMKSGIIYGPDFPNPIEISENGLKILVDIVAGHKTGYYLDQRDSRFMLRDLSAGKKVLDCFSYTGGFSVNSLVGQAKTITLVDSSASALNYAQENFALNNLNIGSIEFVEQDVFKHLRTLRDRSEYFDLIILDPPKFAPTISQAERASRAYKDINLLALKLLNPGGYLMTFSCSGGVSEDLFQKIVASAAVDAHVDGIIIKRLHQAMDHPVALNFPEGAYLKGFLIQKRS